LVIIFIIKNYFFNFLILYTSESYGFSFENIYLCFVSCCSNIISSKKLTLSNKELTVDSFLLKSILVGLTNTKKTLCIDLVKDCLLKAESIISQDFNEEESIKKVNNMDESINNKNVDYRKGLRRTAAVKKKS